MTTSLTINHNELEHLKNYILKNGLKKNSCKSEYELLRIKDRKISIIVYKSGKLVHNDSPESNEVISAILKKETVFDCFIGSDETGKGEWYGPLVVVAAVVTPDEIIKLRKIGVRDSKTIEKDKLKEIAQVCIQMGFPIYAEVRSPERYNSFYEQLRKEDKSLNDMMAWAHSAIIKKALDYNQSKKIKIIIDKFDFEKTEYRLSSVDRSNLEIIQKSKGESEIPVAVASIIAKHTFEKEVDKLNHKYDVDLRKCKPEDLDPSILPYVAKVHFKNVNRCLE